MFAIVNLGDKQFKVQLGDFVRSPFLRESESEKEILLPVLAYGDEKSLVYKESDCKKFKVKARILRHGLAKKVLVLKKKRRKDYRKTRGHRQKFTELQVIEIGASVLKKEVKSPRKEPTSTGKTVKEPAKKPQKKVKKL